MLNKKRVWLLLWTSLAISPILVATAALPWAGAGEPQKAGVPGSTSTSSASSGGVPGMAQMEGPDRLPDLSGPYAVPPTPLAKDAMAEPLTAPKDLGDFPFVATSQAGKEKLPPPPPPPQAVQPPTQPPQPQPQPPQAPTPDTQTPPTTPLYEPKDLLPKLGGTSAPKADAPTVPATAATVTGATTNPGSVGDLLSRSNNALGVEVQKRSPIVGDPRIEGLHFGQVVTSADGAYWFPARVDLDTVVSKINAADINNILIIQGPYSVRYGPGFSFLDIQSIGTPRYKDGFEAHGSSSINYRTNGQGWNGQQSFWGGSSDWGFRISYDLQTAVDYTTGNGTKLPSGYNNQFVNVAYGFNLTPDANLELKYMHAQQSNVVFPGLLTDINNMATDAFSSRFTAIKGTWYDRFTLDTWVNSTSFNGDSSNPGTRQQIPQLNNIFPSYIPANAAVNNVFLPVRLDLTTSGNSLSYGAREITTWGDASGFNISAGSDIKVFSSNYNEFDAFNFSTVAGNGLPANFGIPNGRQIDPGLLLDMAIPVGDRWAFKAGTRIDFLTSQFLGFGTNMNVNNSYINTVGDPNGDRTYALFSGFLTSEYKLTDHWKALASYGYAERAPTLTELYSGGAFLGLIQNGFNSVYGNPNLRKEAMHQMNLGLNANYDKVRAGFNSFYAFMPNYITYRYLNPAAPNFTVTGLPGGLTGTTPLNNVRFVNTPLATLFGFNAYTEVDATPWLTPFATLNFQEGWDQTLNAALSGIAPLSSRVGMRFHDEGKNPRWGIEYFARMMAAQNLFASYIGEQYTGGFVTHNLRGYWNATDGVQLTAGIDNIGNLQYREHLDLRTGSPLTGGVFQPGVNFYGGVRLSY